MFKNIVKNTVAALVLAAPFVSFAAAPASGSSFSYYHKAGFAVQAGGAGVDYAYYTKNHTFTMGVYGLDYLNNRNNTVVYHQYSPGAYVRKNFKIDNQTQYGIGISANRFMGENSSGTDYDNAWGIKPAYIAIEYFATPKIGFSISLRPFEYTNKKAGTNTQNVEEYKYLKAGRAQINYIFG